MTRSATWASAARAGVADALIVLMAVPLALQGITQQALAADEESLFEEVIVTAKKREESIYDVPVAISAFTAEAIEKQGITTLTDVGKFVPNLNVTEFSAGHTSSANPFIRGIGLQDHLITTDPGVGVYVDGVYLGRQVGQNWSLANIERVEVLRGPQGTLYGRNTIGGAVHIITSKPGDEEGGRVSLTAGSRERVNAEFYTNNTLSDTVAVSVTGAYRHRGGLGDFLMLDNPRKEVGELTDISGRVALKWTPTDRLSLLFTADGNDGDNGLRPYTTLYDEIGMVCRNTNPDPSMCVNGAVYDAGFRNSDVSADPYDNNTGQAEQIEVTNQAFGLSLTAEYAISEQLDARLIIADRHSEYSAGLDDDSFFENFLTFPEDGDADQTSVELQFNGEYGDVDFVAGLYFFEEEGGNFQIPNVFLGDAGTYVITQDLQSVAIYGNVGFQVSDRLRISGGLRYTEDDKDAFVNISDFVFTDGHRDWDEFSWELAATQELSDNMSFYGTIQTGYQSGQFPPRAFCLFGNLDFIPPDNVTDDNCFVANDNVTATNYEIGLKGRPANNFSMALSVFYTQYKDLPYQVSTTQGAGFDTRNIIVDQDSFGAEWESTWAISDPFVIHAAIGYIDVDVDDPAAVAPLTPEVTAAVSPEYTAALNNGGELSFRADWSFRDDMFGEPTSDPGRFTMIDSRDLINFDITYLSADGNWTVSAYGTNITDERYDNARLNTGDYILVMLSNDASEFGLRYTRSFGR